MKWGPEQAAAIQRFREFLDAEPEPRLLQHPETPGQEAVKKLPFPTTGRTDTRCLKGFGCPSYSHPRIFCLDRRNDPTLEVLAVSALS